MKHIHKITNFLFFALLICTPLAVEISFGSLKINMPTEPLLLLTTIFLFLSIDYKLLSKSAFIRHPLSLLAIAYQFWMTMMIIFSSDRIISLKYVIVNNVHFLVFYLGFYYFAQQHQKALLKWSGIYGLSCMIVIFTSWNKFMQYDFRVDSAVILPQPFFNDNTIFSACLAMLLPLIFLLSGRSKLFYFVKGFGILLILSAISITFCRAAWISLLISSLVVILVTLFKLKIKHLIGFLVGIFVLAGLLLPTITNNLSTIKTESKKGTWYDQIASIGNITTDVSNLERINRYKCAFRMFRDRPFTGFGPGTFQYAYLSYQKPTEMTRISTQIDTSNQNTTVQNGRGGGAHSEYLQALAEMGFVSFLFWIAFFVSTFYTALKIYYKEDVKSSNRKWSMAIIFGLFTYFIHSVFNNFMHSEEVAILFWPMIAMLAILDNTDNLVIPGEEVM